MNKDQILECYINAATPKDFLNTFCRKYVLYFSKNKSMPENFKTHSTTFSASQSRAPTEIDETLSFYTALSRLTIDQSLLDDVQINHKNHSPFKAINEDKDENYRWYYEQKDNEIFGPLHAHEMDSRYQLGIFGKGTRVKTRGDDSYYPFINILKRYCKILKSKKLNLDNVPKKLSNKIKKFKKGEVVRKRNFFGMNAHNEFQNNVKETRTRTYAPRPTFDLNSLLKEQESKNKKSIDEDEEDMDVPPEGRDRAKTQV
jgi:hypothetical protein